MSIGEIILRGISRSHAAGDCTQPAAHEVPGQELSLLRREFPQFSGLVKGKRVVDFGCGWGRQSVALVKEEACFVCGIDTDQKALSAARKHASENGLTDGQIMFVERPTAEMLKTWDLVISQDAMEHYPDPPAILNEMKGLLRPGGKILITFGPPWYAPYGSHMTFFCKVPWLNLIFSEKTVMSVRARYRNDGATRYEEVESGLNKMSVGKFERIVSQSGLVVEYKNYRCIKHQDWLAQVPVLRELFINQVSCVLSFPPAPGSRAHSSF